MDIPGNHRPNFVDIFIYKMDRGTMVESASSVVIFQCSLLFVKLKAHWGVASLYY